MAALVLVVGFGGCAPYAAVSHRRPRFEAVARGAGSASAPTFAHVAREQKKDPLRATGRLLAIAHAASRRLAHAPDDVAARAEYNFAVARLFNVLQASQISPWSRPVRIPAEGGDYVLKWRPTKLLQGSPALYEFTPADEYVARGKYVREHVRKEGLGAPLVVVRRAPPRAFTPEELSVPQGCYGVTALLRFAGRQAIVELEDPLATESVTLNGHRQPLAADYTLPLAIQLARTNPRKFEILRLLRPFKYEGTTRIAGLQPYDPAKTVVLVIHGLMDSPATWTPMINTLRGDRNIRRHYQFWFYSYPSGYPYPYAAAILRRQLDAVRQRFPASRKMVVVGHSMGGCISRLLITDAGDGIWMQLFGKPPSKVPLMDSDRRLLAESLIFQHRPEVGRVIFIAAPLRGSELAQNWVGRLGSSLVQPPVALLKAGSLALSLATFQPGDLRLKRLPNSVDTLAPNSRFVRAVNTIPVTPGIPHHVICGDRGKGGNRDRTKPVMSDGVVPYWSSHMDTAESECIVPAPHNVHQHPLAIAEVRRILTRHAAP